MDWGLPMGWSWADLPVDRAVRLVGVVPDALALLLDPAPDSAPAVVTFRPSVAPSVAVVVAQALDAIEGAALKLFPAWLPGAAGISGPGGAGVAAVRALARRMNGSGTAFLADLAERALRGGTPSPGLHSAETRTAGLTRALAATYQRASVALVMEVPAGLTSASQETLIGAAEWLAGHGPMGVWLVGGPLPSDRVMTCRIGLPEPLARLDRETPPMESRPDLPILTVPAVSGAPNGTSSTERLLEAALQQHDWAIGRVWHQRYQPSPLDLLRYLDVLWPTEKVVVEVDGEEHRGRLKWADDRVRDNLLQLGGYQVLRYPNELVVSDLAGVVDDIRAHLLQRRSLASAPEGLHHAQR
ncbi:endonuclease domain-containing protein [Hamadaea tsunoensis]|uniref:endonuclease domain-containing protein n=1 Tax=Hamadaea tsunoensis TaxID=53368 RepID=UPI0007E8CC31|nr:DUF559 domain-containing protein [Hamadaea tsunoensis]